MAKAAKIKKQHARASLLTKLLVLLLLAGIGWQLFSLQGQVRAAQAEKAARSQQAIRVCRALEQKDLEARVGQTYDVLFEQQEDGWFTGHIPEYCLVKARGEGLHNRVLPVKITGCEEETLVGEVLA